MEKRYTTRKSISLERRTKAKSNPVVLDIPSSSDDTMSENEMADLGYYLVEKILNSQGEGKNKRYLVK